MGTSNRRFVLVTGTSSGIGAALARLLLERGWTVWRVARRPAPVEHAAEWSSDLPRGRTHRNTAVISYEPGIVDTDMQTLARSHDPARFPWVGMLQGFADRGLLSPAEAPAREIVAFLETDGHPAFSERRLGPT